MYEGCGCNEEQILKPQLHPPYLSQKSLQGVLDTICGNCTGSVPAGTGTANFKTLANIDDCCEKIVIFRGTNQILLSLDSGATWTYVGSVSALLEGVYGSTTFTQNVANNISHQLANTTEVFDEIAMSLSGNNIVIGFGGMYIITATIRLTHNSATPVNITYDFLVNGVYATPRISKTAHFAGANPNTNERWTQLVIMRRFDAGDTIRLSVLSGTTITSNPFNVSFEFVRLTI